MTTSEKALARTTPRRSTLTLAKAQVSQHLSNRLPYYITSDDAHQLIDAVDNGRDHLFLWLLWETGQRVSEAINVKLVDMGREGIRVLGKGGVERVVFIQDSLVAAILFYAQERAIVANDMFAGLGRASALGRPSLQDQGMLRDWHGATTDLVERLNELTMEWRGWDSSADLQYDIAQWSRVRGAALAAAGGFIANDPSWSRIWIDSDRQTRLIMVGLRNVDRCSCGRAIARTRPAVCVLRVAGIRYRCITAGGRYLSFC